MTVFTSQMMSGMIGQQVGMFQGYGGYAQQIGVGSGLYPPMPPSSFRNTGPGQGGMYGEQIAGRLFGGVSGAAGFASSMMMPGGMAGVGLNMLGVPMPIAAAGGGAIMAGLAGGSMLAGGLTAGALALPLAAGGAVASAYGSAFQGGMESQVTLNNTLRSNFNFMGGQGTFGRGFSQNQMGQIGSMISGELRRNPFTTAGELNGLIAGGADAGMFTGVRDVQQFTQNFRRMLNTLRDVQRELGGTLTDALQFVRSSQQAGIFQNADRVNFAAEIRTAEAVTGMDRNQLVALSAQGANISRAFGGMGRQGAFGAMRLAQTLGGAIQDPTSGVTQELLSEVTGGLTGEEAIGATVTNMLSRAGRFSRRAMGRFSTFAMSNERGTGLDRGMMDRFIAGDISVSDVRRAAHRNVGHMGRARAINREGELAGNIMEEGGLAGQIGMMRLMVGDRVLDADDDLGQLVLQRRFGMSRPESELMMNLMRNQGNIAREERVSRDVSGRETERRLFMSQNRSAEAFMTQLEHGLSEATGITAAREAGRRFMTTVSSRIERAMNEFMGATGDGMSGSDRAAISRVSMGLGTSADRLRMSAALTAGGGGAVSSAYLGPTMGERALHALGGHVTSTEESLAREGIRTSVDLGGGVSMRRSARDIHRDVMLNDLARSGLVMGADRVRLNELSRNEDDTTRRLFDARLRAIGSGDPNDYYRNLGDSGSVRAYMAFERSRGLTRGPGTSGAALRGDRGMGGALDALFGAPTEADRAMNFIASGGHLRGELEGIISRGGGMSEAEAAVPARGVIDRGGALAAVATGLVTAVGGGGISAGLRAGMAAYSRTEAGNESVRRRLEAEGGDVSAARDRLRGLTGVSREALDALYGSEDFASRVTRASELSGGALRSHLSSMERYAMSIENPDQQAAAIAAVAQMESNAERFEYGRGSIGTEHLRAARGAGGEDRERATRDELARVSARYDVMASALGNVPRVYAEGMTGTAADRLRGISESFANLSTGTYETREEAERASDEAYGRVRSFVNEMADMDPNSEEYRRISGAIGAVEGGRETMANIADRRAGERELRGEGRRGRRGAVDALLGRATAGTFSNMTFSLEGRGEISAAAARRIMGEGGARAEELYSQMETQLVTRGMTPEEAANQVGALSRLSGELTSRRRRGESEEEYNRRREAAIDEAYGLGDAAGLGAVARNAADARLNAARENDPLAAESLRVLEAIRDRLPDDNQRRAEGAEIARAFGAAINAEGGNTPPPGTTVPGSGEDADSSR